MMVVAMRDLEREVESERKSAVLEAKSLNDSATSQRFIFES